MRSFLSATGRTQKHSKPHPSCGKSSVPKFCPSLQETQNYRAITTYQLINPLGKNLSPGEIESLVTFLKATSDSLYLQN
ncbi:hypothetical protein CH365_12290 [Leptospira neocaledonica]|uniref:Uncharacterized protein n=1 Tax=Leptospira neocaledonica TaxID=2023192 RepID=A0A2M9ZXK9_9LEPT|nr:hypothetical protein CH365_12290 [Leptospira neocaledonica]